MYGEEALYQEAIDFVLPAAYTKAIDELELSPLAMPDIDVKEISKENGVTFEAVVTVKPDVELGEYKNLGIEKEAVEVTDADVEERLESVLSREAEWQVKETEAKQSIPVSISVGLAYSEDTYYGLDELANQAQLNVELALARGGDQTVVRSHNGQARFYGGKWNVNQKRSITRSKLVYQALLFYRSPIIGNRVKVFI